MGFSRLDHLAESPQGHSAYLDPTALDLLPEYLGAEPQRAHQLLETFKACRR